MMLRLGQKLAQWMVVFKSKFCKAEELVPDICAGTSARETACLHLQKQCRLVHCKKYSASYQNSIQSHVKVYGKRRRNSEPEIRGSKKLVEASKLFVKETAAF